MGLQQMVRCRCQPTRRAAAVIEPRLLIADMVAHNGLLISGEQSLDGVAFHGSPSSYRTTLALPAPVLCAMVSPKRSTLLHQERYFLVAGLQMCGEHAGAVLLDDSNADVCSAGVNAKNQVLGDVRGVIVQPDGKRGSTNSSCFLFLQEKAHIAIASCRHQRFTVFVLHIDHRHVRSSPFIVVSRLQRRR